MVLSSILSVGLHLTIFLFVFFGLPFSKTNDRKESTIPLILNEEINVSNKTSLQKEKQTVKPQKNKQIKETIKNSPKPKKIALTKNENKIEKIAAKPVSKPKKKIEKIAVKPVSKPKKKIKQTVDKIIKKKPSKRPVNKINSKNRSDSSKAILRNLAEATIANKKKDKKDKKNLVNQIKESLKNQSQNEVLQEKKATASELDILRYHVAQCWNVPYSANETKIIKLKIFTNPDGSVVNVEFLDNALYNKDPVYRAAADSARRAVKDCSPLPLPKNKYDLFKVFTYNFDASFING